MGKGQNACQQRAVTNPCSGIQFEGLVLGHILGICLTMLFLDSLSAGMAS